MSPCHAALALLAAVGLAGPLGAGEKEARAVVERAIQAHGGAEALKKAATFRSEAKGTRVVAGREVSYERRLQGSLPGRLRAVVTLGGRVTTTVQLDGKGAEQSEGGKTYELGPARVKELQAEADVMWLATVVPLTGAGVALAEVPGAQVGGEEAAGVRATRAGQGDVTLYFSKKTGLLVRVARRGPLAGKEVEMEWTYGGHKEFGGVKAPTKEVQAVGGKKVVELAVGGWELGGRKGKKR